MNNNKFLKIFSIIAFVAFLAVSCWATVESLFMSDPIKMGSRIPYWVVTIGLFVISSIGATLIVNSLNQRIRVDNRGGKLIGGIVLLLVFWIFFSMPTNTHTFFYSNKGEAIIGEDLQRTTMYLKQMSQQQLDQTIAKHQSECAGEIRSHYQSFIHEYDSRINPGFGPKTRENMQKLNTLLADKYGVGGLEVLSGNHSTVSSRNKVIKQYNTQIDSIIKLAQEIIKNTTLADKGIAKQDADKVLKKLLLDKEMMDYCKSRDSTMSLNDIKKIKNDIQDGYTVISNHPDQVRFANSYDKQLYSKRTDKNGEVSKDKDGNIQAQECESARLFNAFSIWQDYLKGKFKGMGFFYWIMLAMLVDIAGFIFFTIAFRKTE